MAYPFNNLYEETINALSNAQDRYKRNYNQSLRKGRRI